ncbi:neutral/alkaline non-lysosomal ceramidase N-terminal domain-containing protein [uncultured Jatrophihabitans sp.]|uniref:neutral/alkaline non-lysosomal ceramidase N-terminal domain-containing protein n=1 Tax=uncultured Jatrophihabitans sp. TaxID=1610747 RepID=UPI0035CADFE5
MTDGWRAGRGIADITGEAAECGMLGYGKADQQTAGIHLRLRSRAFVFEAGAARLLLVINEMALPMESVTQEVLRRLADRYGELYREDNLLLAATHTHCGPGGYSHHATYNSNTGGFRSATFAAIVDGTMAAIAHAHADLAPVELRLCQGRLHDASTNRSPSSFDLDPPEDRAHFPGAIDALSTLLRIERDGRLVGAINWFATHGTSMTNTNDLISSDNKGYAAYHWERLVAGVDYRWGADPDVITAFAQTNTGDMSPNLNHAPDRDATSGPTENEFENTRLIGLRQYDAAAALARADATPLEAVLDSRMTYVDLGDLEVGAEFTGDGRPHRTGPAVAAAAQFAGTDEGPGFTGFRQGLDNPVWNALSRGLWYRASRRLREAHEPKAVVLPAWLVNKMHPMVAERVPVHLVRIGRLYLIGIPGEVTVVAGLRLRRAVAEVLGAELDDVLVAGYVNSYIHYVTTPEEYDGQRYEAASTMFGRWELGAFVQTAVGLARAMVEGVPAPAGPPPPDLSAHTRRWGRPPTYDEPTAGDFGRVVLEPGARYQPGSVVTTIFVGAHLANDVRRGGTFLEIQRDDPQGWTTVADDGDWSTKLHWSRIGRHGSRVTITWDVPPDVRPGWYRVRYAGTARARDGTRTDFVGATREFAVD